MTRARLFVVVLFAVSLLGTSPSWVHSATKTEEKATTKTQEKKAPAKKQLIGINTASVDELKSLEGIGDATAKKIIASRPYKRKDELAKQKIVPERTYEKIQDQIIARQSKAK